MNIKYIAACALLVSVILPVGVERAAALSCLPIDMYLEDVVGKEEIVIFEATSQDRIEQTDYTVEVLTVTKAHQGWVEDKLFVYHEKHPDWGYLCNSGPQAKSSSGIYVATRNEQNQYFVYQRLDVSDPLVTELKTNLDAAKVEGGVSELTKTDRLNQIMTSLQDLLKQATRLIMEYKYWSKN